MHSSQNKISTVQIFHDGLDETGQGLVLYQVPDNADNEPARESICLLGKPFKTVVCPSSVRDLYRMPFVSDKATGRHFGLESIRRFVGVCLAAPPSEDSLPGARRRADDNLRSVFGDD